MTEVPVVTKPRGISSSFKQNHQFDKRKVEARRIRAKYPDRIAVIAELKLDGMRLGLVALPTAVVSMMYGFLALEDNFHLGQVSRHLRHVSLLPSSSPPTIVVTQSRMGASLFRQRPATLEITRTVVVSDESWSSLATMATVRSLSVCVGITWSTPCILELSQLTNLTSLTVVGANLYTLPMAIAFSQLRSLDLRHMGLTYHHLVMFAQRMSSLENLTIRHMGTTVGVDVQSRPVFPRMTTFSLGLTDYATSLYIRLSEIAPNLHTLHLGMGNTTADKQPAIIEEIRDLPCLTHLNLTGFETSLQSGGCSIAAIARLTCPLVHLALRVTDEYDLLLDVTPLVVFSSTLTRLDITSNGAKGSVILPTLPRLDRFSTCLTTHWDKLATLCPLLRHLDVASIPYGKVSFDLDDAESLCVDAFRHLRALRVHSAQLKENDTNSIDYKIEIRYRRLRQLGLVMGFQLLE